MGRNWRTKTEEEGKPNLSRKPREKTNKATKEPTPQRMGEKAAINFKNARRCEQIAYRFEMLHHKTGTKLKFWKS